MPIYMRKDVQRRYSLPNNFFVGDTPAYFPLGKPPVLFRDARGSYLDVIRPQISQQNWEDFHSSKTWIVINAKRDIAKAISLKFDMDPSLNDAFDDLWVLLSEARAYEKHQKDNIKADLDDAYRYAAKAGRGPDRQQEYFQPPRVAFGQQGGYLL